MVSKKRVYEQYQEIQQDDWWAPEDKTWNRAEWIINPEKIIRKMKK